MVGKFDISQKEKRSFFGDEPGQTKNKSLMGLTVMKDKCVILKYVKGVIITHLVAILSNSFIYESITLVNTY